VKPVGIDKGGAVSWLMSRPPFAGRVPAVPDELYERIAEAAVRSGMAAELSSAGWRKPVGEEYPAPPLLKRFVDRGVPLTTASDAHVLALAGWAGLFQSTNSGTTWNANASLGFTPVSFLTLSPSGEAYAAVDGEILYVSYDSGTTWYQAGQGAILPCSAETALVDPTTFNLYVGGGGYGLSCAEKLIVGLGAWMPLAIEGPNGVYGFAITPGSPGILYAATGNGVFQSSDAQRGTWTSAGLQGQTVSAVVVDPSQPATLYALVSGAVFKSTDAGNSWAPSSIGLAASATSLAIAASNGSVLYAGTPTGVYISKNSAASWSHVGPGRNQITALAVDPQSAAAVYAAAPAYTSAFMSKITTVRLEVE